MAQADIIGRHKEKAKLKAVAKSRKSEFIALYGRRRVGKTYLIKEYFDYKFDFYMSGLANADTQQQLINFDNEIKKQSPLTFDTLPQNWLEAFQRLMAHLEYLKKNEKKIIFIDELPWFDTHGTDFMIALEHFWNSWATHRKDIILIVCGSAASWMINELINNKGGLHNRITQKMKIEPFTLKETEEMLLAKKCVLDRYQIIQLYMCIGGMPYYIDAIDPALSAMQNIQALFFDKNSLLSNEFFNLYRSLFKKHEVYEKMVEVLSTKTIGLTRKEIIALSKLTSGGTLTKVLADLEESGFITSYSSLDDKQKNITYRLSDYYTSFYFQFIKNVKRKKNQQWMQMTQDPAYIAWQGFSFEQICLDHIDAIKHKLGISGIQTQQASWRGKTESKAAQIDLLIDRRDHVINICECKFSIDTFTITKSYADALRSKISVFNESSKTKKSAHLTFITTYGVTKNQYSNMLLQSDVVMGDLFG